MKVLAVPNWSFGRDNGLLRQMRDEMELHDVEIHFAKSDLDHNRTVTAFSGEQDAVESCLFSLATLALPAIDLNRHLGCHPRIGGLDVCPFIPYEEPDAVEMNSWVDGVAARLAEEHEIPIFLYEKSEKGKHTEALPKLRAGGFGGLLAHDLDPDFGPKQAHSRLGATVMGWRDFLVALNLNLQEEHAIVSKNLAAKVRLRRRDGDKMFTGVRALGFQLPSQGISQVSMNLTKPNVTFVDPIIQWLSHAAKVVGVEDLGPELIGVIRARDMEHATVIQPDKAQIVEMR
jgi:glutamate formiminotransferase